MNESRFPVEIYYSDESERAKAREVLEDIECSQIEEFDGVIEGSATVDDVAHLKRVGLHVNFPQGIAIEDAELLGDESISPIAKLQLDEHDLKMLRAFRARSRYVDIDDSTRRFWLAASLFGPSVKLQ